jgi:hypothetical protein
MVGIVEAARCTWGDRAAKTAAKRLLAESDDVRIGLITRNIGDSTRRAFAVKVRSFSGHLVTLPGPAASRQQ